MANGDTSSLRKVVTEKMYSVSFLLLAVSINLQICLITCLYISLFYLSVKTLKNEVKRRESMWSSVHWELIEPVVSIRTLRARMVSKFISLASITWHPSWVYICNHGMDVNSFWIGTKENSL